MNDRKGLILSYRRGEHAQYTNQCLMRVIDSGQSDANRMVGLRVGWPLSEPKIYGKIVGTHGKKGVLRVKFKKGLPGQALGTHVKIVK
ncbi:50S ribosomal protein L35ae [Candidatus Bathyarchaeota archaeon]|nr:50S ribosomal protein L35ae [Candidatus Bathyarchaeota archaeon]MDP6048009.1 50S ribosomal protein L35ae [Candidatus Bathyarchaeota archaeon]MDP7206983.1 50S ribosomal protein L35ae [Candidatus Bathyarchaeota archaeon]MDP7443156.1 50S ribosomal protein L35ae [Candidatus Bathyarchaeota archaeon]